MSTEYISNLIGKDRYKLSKNFNTNVQLLLEGKTKPLTEYNVIDIVNQQDLFLKERDECKIYRLNGKLNIYTSNVLTPDALSEFWDPLFYGNPPVSPTNWLMQITFPSEKDPNYTIQSRTPSGTVTPSKAFRGLQYKSLGSITINSNNYLTILGVQRHGLTEGEYIYLYSNSFNNQLQGLHRVKSIGIDGQNLKTDLTLETIVDNINIPTGYGNFIRVFEPSFDDTTFNNSGNISLTTTCDISGNTNGVYQPNEERYLKITTTNNHELLVNNFVEIKTNNISALNGLWRVYNVINQTSFVIKLDLGLSKGTTITYSLPYPNFRIMNGTPCEYYIRKFEILTTNKYEVYPCAFSTNIYDNISQPEIGTANDTWLFHFNQDIDLKNIVDHRGGEVSELYYTIIKRSGKNPYDWSHVTSDWDFNSLTTNTSNGLEIISLNNQSGVGSVEKFSARTETLDSFGEIQQIKGDMYVGDFIEYNSKELVEKTIAEVIHRFGRNNSPNGEGYFYKPFKKLEIRRYSEVIETAPVDEIVINLPGNYETYSDGSIAWKDLLSVGFFENGTNGVDYPFVNKIHYYYFNHNLYVRRQVPPTLIDQSEVNIVVNTIEEC
jgi:hypothetical protein